MELIGKDVKGLIGKDVVITKELIVKDVSYSKGAHRKRLKL
jgi:hypothetical protein